MVVDIDWKISKEEVPFHKYMMLALPGVGNVGKLVVDTIVEKLPSTLIARIHQSELPPHAMMISGLLIPPHLGLYSVELDDETNILFVCGENQPMTASGQYELSMSIIEIAKSLNTELLMVLAGLSSEAGSEEVHLVLSDDLTKSKIEEMGIPISIDEPKGGVIGVAGLVSSMSSIKSVNSCCIVAETFGTSVDMVAAERLKLQLEKWFNIDLPINIDETSKLVEKIKEMYSPELGQELSQEMMSQPDNTFYQ